MRRKKKKVVDLEPERFKYSMPTDFSMEIVSNAISDLYYGKEKSEESVDRKIKLHIFNQADMNLFNDALKKEEEKILNEYKLYVSTVGYDESEKQNATEEPSDECSKDMETISA